MTETKKAYVCTIAFQHEFDPGALIDIKLYPNLEYLKKCHPYWAECGITEVEVKFVSEVAAQNLRGVKKT